jgi:hypothetical protein
MQYKVTSLIAVLCFIVSIGCLSVSETKIETNPSAKKIDEKKIYTEDEIDKLIMPYANIPLDKNYSTVSTGLSDLIEIRKAESAAVEEIASYKILKFYKGGIYERSIYSPLQVFLNNQIVSKYSYSTYDFSENFRNISIFTYRTPNDKEEKIFMIFKTLKKKSINFRHRFNGMISGISKEIGTNPNIYETEFQEQIHISSNTHEPGLVAKWDTKQNRVFLLLRNDLMGYSSDGIIIYISKTGWSNYAKECGRVEHERKKENEKFSDGF